MNLTTTKRMSTYITAGVWLAMKQAADAEGVKLWQFVEQALKMRIAESDRKRSETSPNRET